METETTKVNQEESHSWSARELMNSGGPWVDYVNEVVLREVKSAGISMDQTYKIRAGELSALQVITIFKENGWSWPRRWYRRNRNRAHSGGIHLEKQVEKGKWLHLIVMPQRDEQIGQASRLTASRDGENWNRPPLRIDLHAENRWLQPSSAAHSWNFIKEKYLLSLWRRLK